MPGGISIGVGAEGSLPQPEPETLAPRPIALEVRKYDPNNPPKFPSVDPSKRSETQTSSESPGPESVTKEPSVSQRPYIWKPYPQA